MKRPLFTACLAACFGVVMLFATNAEASFYKAIAIDSDFSDWADVPVADIDGADNPGFADIGTVKVANDDDYLYIYYTSYASLALPTYISLDVDSNTATGFDIFGLGLIGSEVAWQNDFPFTQGTGVFNDGNGMSGDFFGSGAALIAPFGDTPEHELAISLDTTFNAGGAPVFADDDFDLLLWTDAGAGDVSAPISYTLASVPEPTSLLLCVAMSGGCLAARRRV